MTKTTGETLALLLLVACCGDGRDQDSMEGGGIPPSEDGADTGDGGTGGDGSDGQTDTGDGDGGGGPDKFDVGGETGTGDGGPGDCPGEGDPNEFDFSYIWIANSPQGTVSKIDTVSAIEVARYRTGAGAPDPSRTSVNLEGDVAVLNRSGSVVKIAAQAEDCVDQNGDGTIHTSTGPTDILPWGQDECVLWHTELDYTIGGGPRTIAWTAGDPDAACTGTEADVWVGFRNDPDLGLIRRLDGDTGVIDERVDVAGGWRQIFDQGLYGGAMDGDGNLWVIGKGGTLLRLNTETLAQDRWEQSPPTGTQETFYGFAVGADGAPWIAGQSGHLYRFDPSTETFAAFGPFDKNYMGVAIDRDGFAWVAHRRTGAALTCGVTKFDTASESLVAHVDLPGCSEPVGVSIDVEGYVWVVDMLANVAFKVDPSAHTSTTVTGLVAPYTYSDMTGAGLKLVVVPPAG